MSSFPGSGPAVDLIDIPNARIASEAIAGVPADCAALAANPTGGLAGMVTVNAAARIDRFGSDNVTTSASMEE